MFISRNKVPNNIFSRLSNLFHLLFTNIWRLTRTSIYTTRFHSIWNDSVFKIMNLMFIWKFCFVQEMTMASFWLKSRFWFGESSTQWFGNPERFDSKSNFYALFTFDISIFFCSQIIWKIYIHWTNIFLLTVERTCYCYLNIITKTFTS